MARLHAAFAACALIAFVSADAAAPLTPGEVVELTADTIDTVVATGNAVLVEL